MFSENLTLAGFSNFSYLPTRSAHPPTRGNSLSPIMDSGLSSSLINHWEKQREANIALLKAEQEKLELKQQAQQLEASLKKAPKPRRALPKPSGPLRVSTRSRAHHHLRLLPVPVQPASSSSGSERSPQRLEHSLESTLEFSEVSSDSGMSVVEQHAGTRRELPTRQPHLQPGQAPV